eukprot:s3366_g7.t1
MKKPASAKGLKESPNKRSRKDEKEAPESEEIVATAEETQEQKQEGLQDSQPAASEEASMANEPEEKEKEDKGLKEGQTEVVPTEDLAAKASEAAAAKVFEEAAALCCLIC